MNSDMKFYLDGDDWEADYFLSHKEFEQWRDNCWDLKNMYLDSAETAGFANPDGQYRASFRGRIPGSDRTMLLENHKMDDPYWSRNMDASRWSENYAWGFRKHFTLPAALRSRRRFQLHLCGIDYSCQVYLNGEALGQFTGMFLPHEMDVTDFLHKDGDNLLALVFLPMPKASPNHLSLIDQRPAEFAQYHRSQMSWGWDWMRGMAAAGIWDSIYLQANDDVRISDLFFHTEGSHVNLKLETIAQAQGDYELKLSLAPLNFEGKTFSLTQSLRLTHGINQSDLAFDAPHIRKWYPNGYGPQPLYNLTLEIGGEVTRRTVAFKDIEMHRNPDSPDGAVNHTFTINGREIFVRGANWVPADLMLSRVTSGDYERLVRLAAESGTNLFRVWGGGIIEKEAFYDACDRHGILVWQEFMHACSNYPKDGAYLGFKRKEGEAILKKLRNHVSVSLICGGNEMQYYGETPEDPLLVQYGELTEKFAPHLPFRVTSPNLSIPGERHHGPWSFCSHDDMNRHHRLFVSEIGCNGFCEAESVRRFIPECDLGNPEAQSWKYHFNPPCRVFDWKIPQKFFAAENLEERCQASMFAQSDCLGYWMNHCRRKSPRTTGCVFWQYNEPWPTLAWSYVDYYHLPKMAYYRLCRVQKPAILSLKDHSWCCANGKLEAELYLTADMPLNDATATCRILTMDGQLLHQAEYSGSFSQGTSKLSDILAAAPPAPEGGILLAELRLVQAGSVLFQDTLLYGCPDYRRVFQATPARLDCQCTVICTGKEQRLFVTLHNRGKIAALQIRLGLLDVDINQIYWKDNYVTVSGGESRVVEACLTVPAPPATLVLSGWNLPASRIAISAEDTASPGNSPCRERE